MPTRPSAARGRLAAALLALAALCLAAHAPAFAQAAPPQDEERQRAFALYAGQQFFEALPLLERLAERYPKDGDVLARLGFSLFARAVAERDAQKRQALGARARGLLVRAKELGFGEGVHKDLVDKIIDSMNPDGSDAAGGAPSRFSDNAEADAAMRAGEDAFVRGDSAAALAAYERALQLDPRLYEAPLFSGDVFLKQGDFAKAGEWYARAIQLAPDREQAYRYWGNVLLRQARLDEARDKYVEAVVADPYNPYVWQHGLFRWAQAKAVRLGHPEINPPGSVTTKGNETTITVDPKAPGDDGSEAWMVYGLTRAAWAANNHERFRKAYPDEKEYRHSLREEVDALVAVVDVVKGLRKQGKVKRLAPDLEALVKLHDDGLLEAYALFARVRQVNSLAHDYAAYRREHRDKLRRYLVEHLASGKY
ncbi:MAG TPA: tetratricopeptide repeat protein [Pyrinomonadaceae bacterium]|nr:tetratricopeptide repeat protein [Pyrinomonadaceae bacterium]